MFGLEKKDKPLFEFDLEKELRSEPEKAKALLKKADAALQEIKSILRQGAENEDFESYGKLLHAYAALQRVLTRIANKK